MLAAVNRFTERCVGAVRAAAPPKRHFDFNLLSAALSVSSNRRKTVSRTENAGASPVTDSMTRCHACNVVRVVQQPGPPFFKRQNAGASPATDTRRIQIDRRARAYTSQLVQGSPSRFISADARVRFPQLRPALFFAVLPVKRRSRALSRPTIRSSARTNAGFNSLHCDDEAEGLDGALAVAPGRSASPDCPQGPGSIPTPSAM